MSNSFSARLPSRRFGEAIVLGASDNARVATDHADLKRRHEMAVSSQAANLIRTDDGFWRAVRPGGPLATLAT